MERTLRPNLDVLPASQRALWSELAQVPKEFALYGGTAIALHLGHRQSVDFDFFGTRALNPTRLRFGPVNVSFFGVSALPRLEAPLVCEDTGLQVASLIDLAGTKVSVVQVRAEAKDYIDLDALMSRGGISLSMALSAGQELYGSSFNPQIALKALSYFEDGNLQHLPGDLRDRLVAEVRAVDLDRLPSIRGYSRDEGFEL